MSLKISQKTVQFNSFLVAFIFDHWIDVIDIQVYYVKFFLFISQKVSKIKETISFRH